MGCGEVASQNLVGGLRNQHRGLLQRVVPYTVATSGHGVEVGLGLI